MTDHHKYLRRQLLETVINATSNVAMNNNTILGNSTSYNATAVSDYSNSTSYNDTAVSNYTEGSNSTADYGADGGNGLNITGSPAADALVIAWIVLVVGCLLGAMIIPRRASDEDEAQARPDVHSQQRRRRSRPKFDPEVRKALIDHSLTVKKVTNVDEHGTLTFGVSRKSCRDCTKDPEHPVHDNDDEDTSMCAICLSGFEVGDDVAWSRPKHADDDPACRHVVRALYCSNGFCRCCCGIRVCCRSYCFRAIFSHSKNETLAHTPPFTWNLIFAASSSIMTVSRAG